MKILMLVCAMFLCILVPFNKANADSCYPNIRCHNDKYLIISGVTLGVRLASLYIYYSVTSNERTTGDNEKENKVLKLTSHKAGVNLLALWGDKE